MENKIIELNQEVKEMVEHKESNAVAINTRDADIVAKNMEAINKIATTIKQSLIDGVDFGIIPGVAKPSLFKSGAEKIAQLFGLFQNYDILEKLIDRENGIIKYQFKCFLTTFEGVKIAEGYGTCSSEERKYSKQNPFDIENTILKMAKKRALVDASISIGVLSEVFTQDVEDLTLSTKNNSAEAVLNKTEYFALYTYCYAILGEFKTHFKDKNDFKEAVKALIPKMIKNAKIEKVTFQDMTRKEAQAFRDCYNQEKNMEILKNEFKKAHNI